MTSPAQPVPSVQSAAKEAAMLRTLNKFAVDLIQIPSVEDLYWYVAQNVVGRLSFVDCVIYQTDEGQNTLRQVAAWGQKNPYARSILNPLVIPFGKGITGKTAETAQPIIVDDLLQEQNYIPDTEPARSEICVPLIFRGKVVGVIDCEHPEPFAFGEVELEILATVAAMTSAKLELLAEAQKSAQRYHDLVLSHAQISHETNVRKALESKLFEARRLEGIGKLTGRFAHEFNNLLTVILGNLELLESDRKSPEALQYLIDAKAAGTTSARLMRDMLAFAQRTRLQPAEVNINDLVVSFSQKMANRGTELALDLCPQLWPVSADPRALETVITSLIDNALHATENGGTIRIETSNDVQSLLKSSLTPMETPPGRYVMLKVIDTGCGIPENAKSQIFDPFFTTKPIGQGSGLGLSIVLGLVQQSRGEVSFESDPKVGSTFTLRFPAIPKVENDLLTMP
jgi:signal transduction histidine kinase